jgi:hypothetical protein
MSHPDGGPPRPRRIFDLDTLVDYVGLFLVIPLIVFVTWLILNSTHVSLGLTDHLVDELFTAAGLDALTLVAIAGLMLLYRHPPIGLISQAVKVFIVIIFCAGGCCLTAFLLHYWSQPK